MKHPFEALKSDYESWVAHAVVRPEKEEEVLLVARHILDNREKFRAGCEATAVPLLWAGPSFYRESNLDFRTSPAQGDRWDRKSINVPAGRGPFHDFSEAQIDAYRIDHLDRVGAGNWTLELACYYWESFNGWAYRDKWHIRSPYDVGGLSIQQNGKYIADHVFRWVMDSQLGCLAIALKMMQLDPTVALPSSAGTTPWPNGIPPATPMAAVVSAEWVQAALNYAIAANPELHARVMDLGGDDLLRVDGNYGRKTHIAVRAFEVTEHIQVDGIAGPEVVGKLQKIVGPDWKPPEPTDVQ
jgi:lysozyme family protein